MGKDIIERDFDFEMPVRGWVDGRYRQTGTTRATVRLVVDLAALAREMGVRALHSKARKAAAKGGIMRARVLSEQTVPYQEPEL